MKCCLTCAFCIRNQNTWLSIPFNAAPSKWRYEQKSLSLKERKALEEGDDSFIGKEIRIRKNWDAQLTLAKEQFKKNNPQFYLLQNSLLNGITGDKNTERKKYGLPPCPSAPDEDYLSCFHEQWNENNNISLQENRKLFLKKKKCAFYFPFKNMDSKSLIACEKTRKELQDKKRFFITNFFVLLGISVTILGIAITVYISFLIAPGQKKNYSSPMDNKNIVQTINKKHKDNQPG